MIEDNSVVFKGKKNGITILLSSDVPFDRLTKMFREKVISAKDFFGASKTSISFSGRSLTEEEENKLLNIISVESGLKISFVDNGFEINNEEKILAQEPDAKITDEDLLVAKIFDSKENITKYHKGSLRSGQSIRFSGSVVIIGDINPGGEVIAEGNITVLGNLKGLVHAGCMGDRNCFVSAFDMQPTQLRIADFFTHIPKEMTKNKKDKFLPSYAYIEDSKIFIAPLI